MTEAVEPESRGLKFAERQLLRHGWEQGKGLGRKENGISEAIKVKVKSDKGGVGHQQGEQFTFHWWDHVFNKASASLTVESDQEGVKVKKTAEGKEDEGAISNKKPRKAELAKAKLYGRFVKSATLLSGLEQPEKKVSSSEDSGSEDEDQRLDLSSTTKLSDEDLVKACGGRTAHKGARHGLTMNAKLARLEQQEQEFLAKYGKKSQAAETSVKKTPVSNPALPSPNKEETLKGEGKKSKKKKRSKESREEMVEDESGPVVSETDEVVVISKKKKKKKKKKKPSTEDDASVPEEPNFASTTEADVLPPKKKKRTNKEMALAEEDSGLICEIKETAAPRRKECGKDRGECALDGAGCATVSEGNDLDVAFKKKKKKSSKGKDEVLVAKCRESFSSAEMHEEGDVHEKKKKNKKH